MWYYMRLNHMILSTVKQKISVIKTILPQFKQTMKGIRIALHVAVQSVTAIQCIVQNYTVLF